MDQIADGTNSTSVQFFRGFGAYTIEKLYRAIEHVGADDWNEFVCIDLCRQTGHLTGW